MSDKHVASASGLTCREPKPSVEPFPGGPTAGRSWHFGFCRRYAIVSDADLKAAAAKLAAVGTVTGTAAVSGVDRRPQIRDTPGTGG